MSLEILQFFNREDWLKARDEIRGIGGSDAAAACGVSRRKSRTQLWNEKTGRAKPKDLSGVDYVQMGVKTEGPMRDLFDALHPELEISHAPFDIYRQKERPWLFATLDGEIRDRATVDKGVLEIKKVDLTGKDSWKEWNGRVSDEYFYQITHQLAATGYAFVYLWAMLRHRDGDITLREYYFPRYEHEEDIAALIQEESKFMDFLESGRVPSVPLAIP